VFCGCRPSGNGNTNSGNISTQVKTAVSLPAENIKIASFNTQILGQSKLAKSNTLTVLSSIITRFDIVALQEVGSNSSASSDATCALIMDRFVARVNELSSPVVYAYVRGNQYAIVYRTDTIRLISSGLYSGTENFTYIPMTACFSTTMGNFDFAILTIHTSPSSAVKEIPALKKAISEVSVLYSEPDVICLGDYNGDGAYYKEGTELSLAGFDGFITGIPNSADTTVAAASYTYDRIEMTGSMKSDYANIGDVFVFSNYYDLTKCEGSVSDHYPVFCEYYINRDTD